MSIEIKTLTDAIRVHDLSTPVDWLNNKFVNDNLIGFEKLTTVNNDLIVNGMRVRAGSLMYKLDSFDSFGTTGFVFISENGDAVEFGNNQKSGLWLGGKPQREKVFIEVGYISASKTQAENTEPCICVTSQEAANNARRVLSERFNGIEFILSNEVTV